MSLLFEIAQVYTQKILEKQYYRTGSQKDYFSQSKVNEINNILDFSFYEGDIYDGMMHGFGKLHFKDGSYHDGQFKFDKPSGSGTRTYPGLYEISGIFSGFDR